jgi:hypothetical protein
MNKLMGLILMLAAVSVQAEPDALVQAVQMPAWLQRDANKIPVRVGSELRNGDTLVTGANARIYVRTADDSTLKLGENAALTLDGLAQQHADQSLFSAVLNVAKGAFRFTTDAQAKLKSREVTIKVAGATVGIRGTDVWGKDGSDQGVVCLIEGKISINGPDSKDFTMDQPLSLYKIPKDAAPLPVAPVDPEQLKKWAAETDIAQPASQLGGLWKVDLLSAPDQTAAFAAYDQWRAAGYDVRMHPVAKDGGWTYMLRIVQLPDRAAAQKLAEQLKGTLGAENPSVSR